MNLNESLEFEQLYDSMWKCKRGKIGKASVARFVLNGIEETLKLEEELKSGTYLPRKPHVFQLTYPKLRPCSSTHIRDRIVQRSLNDNIIYPEMTRSFIWDNMSCQKGKGTTKAMDRLDCFLHRYYINNGSNKGYVAQFDIHGYYRNMRHDKARECFLKHLDKGIVSTAFKWLERQYIGDLGYEPGSQMIQILGISFLDETDHIIKEKLHAKYYGRYMDDFYIISNNKSFLEKCKAAIANSVSSIGLELNPDKTRIYPIKDGINFLGFTYKLTDSGEVVRLINPNNVKHERKKLRRMANLVIKGKITKHKLYECYTSWRSHAECGNSSKVIDRMNQYVKQLMEEINEYQKENREHH